MLTFTQWSKYQAETVSIVLSFADLISSGDAITGVPVVTITVASGLDGNPSNLLYQGVTVTNGNTIEQRFRLGVIGVIYTLTFTIQTVAGDTFEKECYLAILPDDDSAVPNWLPYWRSTGLYPQQVVESMQGNITLTAGRLFQNVVSFLDSLQGAISLLGGSLIGNGITYNIPHEDIQGNIALSSGTLVNNGIVYNIPHEDIRGDIAIISGTLVNTGINYNIPHEDLQGNITLVSGTLV